MSAASSHTAMFFQDYLTAGEIYVETDILDLLPFVLRRYGYGREPVVTVVFQMKDNQLG